MQILNINRSNISVYITQSINLVLQKVSEVEEDKLMDLKVSLMDSTYFLAPYKPQKSQNQALKYVFIFSALKNGP